MEKVQVYKFGGASVKDAAAILNLCRIVRDFGPQGPLVIVVSAMGKTTNALEEIFNLAWSDQDNEGQKQALFQYHATTGELLNQEASNAIPTALSAASVIENHSYQLNRATADLADANNTDYDQAYDQVVSLGERLSAQLVSGVLSGYWGSDAVAYLPATEWLRTDENWREGRVDWSTTTQLVQKAVGKAVAIGAKIIVTEGFIGSTTDGRTTTLGREGSDYTAAILAYCLRAEAVTIWKDVAGLLNADPKIFPDTVRYPEISYRETIEMAYYGASVIHPKTLKPLADRNIPLRVKSFLDPAAEGTIIHDCQHPALAPAFIRKTDQCLLSFASKDFSFISEENLAVIFAALAQAKLKINVMQNSAISFSVCVDFSERRVHQLLDLLREQFLLHYNTGLMLFTIRNYDAASIAQLTKGKRLLLEQRTRGTFQFVCAA
ncbi:aspartate kinase [Hymenobacter sp. DH14]|uniref:Aspartokinase n=1 Tax=Hymenobacter cyanobacteriorum TaxID=2926463 RepID=A0A9X1VBZ4_9BACT|nr:aspartate kinase [Hymenobacter cyanobacteriorum]MCI1185847.1 aspartate kinase [Hymenobacter cyanobacteriorum]